MTCSALLNEDRDELVGFDIVYSPYQGKPGYRRRVFLPSWNVDWAATRYP
jgi:hypothetical protein